MQNNSLSLHLQQIMNTSVLVSFFLATLFFNIPLSASSAHHHPQQAFHHCLTLATKNSISQLLYTSNNSSFSSIWEANINNQRFNLPSSPRPFLILTPVDESQIQNLIYCSKKHGIKLRIRGGGHDFEGISYTASQNIPFVMLDLSNMRSVSVDVATKTAWVQGGATLGDLYYRIYEKSRTLSFPGGTFYTIGVGGLISGGGYGTLSRKYGLAADNVLDVRMMDVNGKILDRKSMGEDLFWAIRGGGASSFGVILAWKLNLVDVPETVTVFATTKTLEDNATSIFHKWQNFAPNADRDLFMGAQLTTINSSSSSTTGGKKKTILITFNGVFLGGADRFLEIVQDGFSELGMTRKECTEVSYIHSVLVISGLSIQAPPETLLNRSATLKFGIKGKSDFVRKPIPIQGIEGLWKMLFKTEIRVPNFVLSPYGGRMNEISESATPFPHRAGNLYVLLESAILDNQRPAESNKRRTNWTRSVYDYLRRYVSNSPRSSYINYIDLDLGVGTESFEEASTWGSKYFGAHNFERLVRIKSKVDPTNFFSHPQSIPPFTSF